MFERARKAYLLIGVEPEFDCANPRQAVAVLEEADLVVMLTPFRNEAAMRYADVLLPVAAFTETSGTYVNTEGRVQSVQGVCRPRGEARPGWKVLRVFGNVLELPGFDYESSEAVRDEFIPAGAAFAGGLDNGIDLPRAPLAAASSDGLRRIADVPIHFADPLARRAASLQKTRDAAPPAAFIHPETLARLGIASETRVRVKQGSGEAVLTARADAGVPPGCVRVAAAHAATASLGGMFAPINVECA
jgi:NADH-quinone oxidoreductase subunit G